MRRFSVMERRRFFVGAMVKVYALWPKQAFAMKMLGFIPEDLPETEVHELFYGGEVAGGKSLLLRAMALKRCVSTPGATVALFRKTHPALRDNHILKFLSEVPQRSGGRTLYKYSQQEHEIVFSNGSRIQFRHCDHEDDVYNYMGAEWDMLLIDEVTQFSAHQYTMLRSRVRWPTDQIQPSGWHRRIVSCGNPGGIGHNYFKQNFVDAASPGDVFPAIEEGTGWPRMFLRASLRDNPSITEDDYRATVAGISDPVLRKAYMTGNWNITGDQMFNEFDREIHTDRGFPIPREWRRRHGLDYGWSNPMCFLWGAIIPANEEIPTQNPALRVSPLPRIAIYRELYETKLYPQMQALKVKAFSGDEPRGPIFADRSMFSKEPGANYAANYAAMGVHLQPSGRDTVLGAARVHQSLDYAGGLPPELLIFDGCKNLLRTLPNLPRDKNNLEKVDTNAEDHAFDALRYMLIGGHTSTVKVDRQYRFAA